MRRWTDWPWWKVKAALAEKEKALSDVADAVGVTRAAVSMIKRIPNPKMQAAVAAQIGVPPQVIWPTRYLRCGRPVSRHIWLKNNTARAPGQREIAA